MVAPFEGILKTVLDSGFRPWISDSSHSIPDSVRGIPDFQGFEIQNLALDSLIHKQKFSGFPRQKWKRALRKSHAAHSVDHT